MSDKTTHSPGEWRIEAGEIVAGGEVIGALYGAERAIADDDEEYFANAALIAAAPCLLAALRGLLSAADAMWEEKGMGHDWREACQAARAVIARAKGALAMRRILSWLALPLLPPLALLLLACRAVGSRKGEADVQRIAYAVGLSDIEEVQP